MHLNRTWLFILFTVGCASLHAQSVLHKSITMNVNGQRLGYVLKLMEQRGNFNFSYNSNLIPKDSLVSLQIANRSVKDALDQLLSNRFEYREAQNYIILRYAPSRLALTTDKIINEDHTYHISGYIINEQNGQKLANASIFDRRSLESTLSDLNGYFDLKIKNEEQPITLTITKENYKDTTVTFLNEVTVNGNKRNSVFRYLPGDISQLERTGISRLLISSKQQIQSLNLGGLITQQPFQASLVPGLSSHGSLSGQVVNKFSLNLIGGYNAGVNGVELAGLFNLDKSDVSFTQIATAFNIVGGSVSGVQVGGGFNQVYGNFEGVQFAGGLNALKGKLNGVQLAIGLNTAKNMDGVQVAAANIAAGDSKGTQTGVINIATKKLNGMQIGALNYTRNLRGVQIGLINFSDTSSGASIGLINFVRTGYHKIALNTNETIDANLLFKTGTPLLYNVWTAGANLSGDKKLYAGGLGFGNQITIANWLSLNTEITSRYVYQGDVDKINLLNRADVALNIRFSKSFAITAGPSLNYFYSDQKTAVDGYAYVNGMANHHQTGNAYLTRWWGWTVGITLF